MAKAAAMPATHHVWPELRHTAEGHFGGAFRHGVSAVAEGQPHPDGAAAVLDDVARADDALSVPDKPEGRMGDASALGNAAHSRQCSS